MVLSTSVSSSPLKRPSQYFHYTHSLHLDSSSYSTTKSSTFIIIAPSLDKETSQSFHPTTFSWILHIHCIRVPLQLVVCSSRELIFISAPELESMNTYMLSHKSTSNSSGAHAGIKTPHSHGRRRHIH